MSPADTEAYLRMDGSERARWRRDNPHNWRTSRIALALATYRSRARQRRAAH